MAKNTAPADSLTLQLAYLKAWLTAKRQDLRSVIINVHPQVDGAVERARAKLPAAPSVLLVDVP